MTRSALWAAFGYRLKWAREARKISKTEAAEKLTNKLNSIKPAISRRHIAYWETIDTPEESATKTKMRPPRPREIIHLVEIYGINGLWLFLYEREPTLSPEPPTRSALYGRPEARNASEIWLTERIQRLNESDIALLVDAIGVVRRI